MDNMRCCSHIGFLINFIYMLQLGFYHLFLSLSWSYLHEIGLYEVAALPSSQVLNYITSHIMLKYVYNIHHVTFFLGTLVHRQLVPIPTQYSDLYPATACKDSDVRPPIWECMVLYPQGYLLEYIMTLYSWVTRAGWGAHCKLFGW